MDLCFSRQLVPGWKCGPRARRPQFNFQLSHLCLFLTKYIFKKIKIKTSCLKPSTVNRGLRIGPLPASLSQKAAFNLKFILFLGTEWCSEGCRSHRTSGQDRADVSQPSRWAGNAPGWGDIALGVDGPGTGNSHVSTTLSFLLRSASPVDLPRKQLLGLSHLHPGCFFLLL